MPISTGNRKVPYPNVSLIPIIDCANCAVCKRDCYAVRAYRLRATARNAWGRNSELAHRQPTEYWGMIAKYIQRHAPRFFRYHVAGDILHQRYLDNMMELAHRHHNTRFMAYTKQFSLNYSGLPGNLCISFSRWPGDREIDNGGLPQVWMQDGTDDRVPDDAIKCSGYCGDCRICWYLNDIGRDVYIPKH